MCYHNCVLNTGQKGRCGVRIGEDGGVQSLVYGKLIAENIDPVEKKPLFHCVPGSLTYSIATPGCNFSCQHCQNSSISQVSDGFFTGLSSGRKPIDRSPDEVVTRAIEHGCKSISYTYVEPTIFFEYALDCARLGAEKGLGNIFVSNGYMSEQALMNLAPFLTAINIDLKSWSDNFYKKVCGARVAPVLANIKKCVELGIWLEVTTLLIPGLNDSSEELQEIATFLAELDRNIPWHVTAFYPSYKMGSIPPTPISTIERAQQIGYRAGLHYVYSGNVVGSRGAATLCPGCNKELIDRSHFTLTCNQLSDGQCSHCGERIAGVWSFQ